MIEGRIPLASDAKASPPWTVYVMVLLTVGSLAWSTIVDPERNLWDLGTALVTLWITYSLWVGKSWAFTLSFAAAVVCGVFFFLFVTVHLILGDGVHWSTVSTGVWSIAWILLLLHPATEAFGRAHEAPRPQPETTA